MRKWITNGLLVGAMTLIVGATMSLMMPSGGSGIALAGGTVGAIAAAFLSKRQENQSRIEILQEVRRVAKAVDEIESQISQGSDIETLATFKDQIQQLQGQLIVSQQSQQITSDTINQLQKLLTQLSETQQRWRDPNLGTSPLINFPTHRTTPRPPNFTANSPKPDANKPEGAESIPASAPQITELLTWLSHRHVQVTTHRQPAEVDVVFDRLALFLGERYGSLAPLLKKIKVAIQTGSRFRLSLVDRTQTDIANCTQFCRMLKDDSFLSYYYYSPLDKVIQAAPQRTFTNFFNGDWFERFVYRKVCDLLTANDWQYEYLINPDVILANTNKFGLDLLFLAEQEPLWIECKTGQDYTAFLERYSNHRKALGITKERSFLVILDISENQTIDLTNLWDITVVNRDNFLNQISANLNLTLPWELELKPHSLIADHHKLLLETSNPVANQDNSSTDIPPGKLLTFLRRQNLRPLPAERPQIIKELVKLISGLTTPLTLTEIKAILAHQLQDNPEISNVKLHQVLKAIAQSGSLQNQAGEIINSFNLPLTQLVTVDAEIIEEKCILSYANTILAFDPNYFQSPEQIKEFELVVGGRVPRELLTYNEQSTQDFILGNP
jgi:hypothetical protein